MDKFSEEKFQAIVHILSDREMETLRREMTTGEREIQRQSFAKYDGGGDRSCEPSSNS